MGYQGHIDRRKHEVDVIEHVLSGGVRAEERDEVRAKVVALDAGGVGWPFGFVASAVQVQVVDEADEVIELRDRPPPADGRTPSAHRDRERPRSR